MNMGNISLEPRSHLPSETCPSELELDRFHYGELRASKEEALTKHVEECPACAARLRARESGFAAFSSVDPDRIFSRVRTRLEHEPKPSLFQRIQRALVAPPVFIPLAAAAGAIFLFLARMPEEDVIRSKGPLSLSIFRERDGSVEELQGQQGDFRAGDRVRFKVKLSE